MAQKSQVNDRKELVDIINKDPNMVKWSRLCQTCKQCNVQDRSGDRLRPFVSSVSKKQQLQVNRNGGVVTGSPNNTLSGKRVHKRPSVTVFPHNPCCMEENSVNQGSATNKTREAPYPSTDKARHKA